MNLSAILNADMATVGRMLNAAFTWWVDELRGIAGPALKSLGRRRKAVVQLDESGRLPDAARVAGAMGGAILMLPSGWALQRAIRIPVMSDANVARMLALDGERFVPLPSGEVLLAVASGPATAGQMPVDIAALPRPRAAAAAEVIIAARALPAQVCPAGVGGVPETRFDFLPAMRAAGLLPRGRTAPARWWMVVGLLFVLNIGALILRDAAEVRQLRAAAEGQRPAVAAAKRISARIAQSELTVRQSLVRRANRDALGTLAAASEAMPDGAWVQRYTWTGTTLRLTGYRAVDVNVTNALRSSSRFSAVRTARSENLAEIDAGTPFDIIADVRVRR